jgi:hypothetical protein
MSSSPSSHSDSASPPDAAAAPVVAYEIPSDQLQKPYHAKRPHKKSRTGCKSCKARKVKCDEVRPACKSCRLRKTECVYPVAQQSTAAAASTSSATAETTATSPPAIQVDPVSTSPEETISRHSSTTRFSPASNATTPLLSSSSFDNALDPATTNVLVVSEPLFRAPGMADDLDMRLLWFYTTATCSAFSIECGTERPIENIMRTKLVQHAFGTPFLMHSLFALSSLHLQNLGQDVESSRALTYRAKAYQGYRKAVEDGRPEDFPGLMANSLLLTALSSQNFRDPEGKPLYIVDWMIVWRGIGLMIKMMGVKSLTDSGLATLFYRPPMDLSKSSQSIPDRLLYMVSSIPPDDIDFAELETYFNTLNYLGTLYMYLRSEGLGPIMKLRIITWFTFIPHRFVELAQEKRPRVLVILAYYAMFLKLTTSVWWIRGIGQRTLFDINIHLSGDAQWAELLDIPLRATGVDNELELCRVILEDPTWISPLQLLPGDLAFDPVTQASINALTWVDNTGRKVMVQDNDMVLVDRTVENDEPVWQLP